MSYRGIYTTIICLALSLSSTHGHSTDLKTPLYNITVPEVEIIGQFHGDPINADLRLYMAGNQFVGMDLLIKEFKFQNPDIEKYFMSRFHPAKN